MNNQKNVLNENKVKSKKKSVLKKSHKYLKGGKSSKKKKSIKSPLNVADNIASGFSNVFNTLTNMIMGEPPDVKFLSVPYVSEEGDKNLKTNMTSESKDIFLEQIGSSPEGRAFREYLERCQVVDDEDGEQEGGGENEEGEEKKEEGEEKKEDGEEQGGKDEEGEQQTGKEEEEQKEEGEEQSGKDEEGEEQSGKEEEEQKEEGEEQSGKDEEGGEEQGGEGGEDEEEGENEEGGEEQGDEDEEGGGDGEEGEDEEWTYTITPGQLKNYADKFCFSREDLFEDEEKQNMFKLPDEDIQFEVSTKCEGEETSEEESDDDEDDEEEEEEESDDEYGNHPQGYKPK